MNNVLYTVPSYQEALSFASSLIAKKTKERKQLNIVFTPEKSTMILESAITSISGGFMNTRVFSFAKYLKYSNNQVNILSREASVMIIRKILEDVKDDLSCFKTYSTKIAENLYDSIALLKSAKVLKEDILQATDDVDGLLKAKLSDLALVYDKYEGFLANDYFDETAMLSVIPSVMAKDDKLKDTDVFLVGFDSWTRQARNIISLLLTNAKSVTLIAVGGSNEGVYTNEIPKAFLALANDLGQKVTVYPMAKECEERAVILDGLYSEKAFSSKAYKSDKVEIFKFYNLLEEVRFACKTIRKKVIDGARYKDFTIALPSTEDYADLIKKVFADYGVPYYLDEKKSFASHPLARLIISYLEMVRKNLSQDSVLDFVKNPLFNQDKLLGDKFENYVLKYNVKFNGFKKQFNAQNGAVENLRQKLMSLVFDNNGSAKTVRYLTAVEDLLVKLDIENSLIKYAETLSEGDPSEASYTLKAYATLMEILSFVKAFAIDVKMDLKEFVMLLKSGFMASEISIIPQRSDAVYIGGYKDCGNLKAKYLFAVGLNGYVPEIKQDIAVLSDGDINRLSELQVIIEPKVRAVNAREREIFATALSAFSDKLYLTYAVEGRNGKELKRSDALSYLEKLFGKKAVLFDNQNFDADGALIADRYLSPLQAQKQFALETGLFRDGLIKGFDGASACYYAFGDDSPCQKILDSDGVSFAERKIVTAKPVVKEFVSASMLENYYACPFKCFMDYGLRLTEREIGEIRPKDSGNFIHRVAELYAEEFKKGGILTEEDSDKVTEEIVNGLVLEDDYIRYREDLTNDNALTRLMEESFRVTRGLFYQLKNTNFKVVGAEVSFGYPDSKYKPILLKSKHGDVKIRGKVDRVDALEVKTGDAYKKYFRVIDYKTGNEQMSDKELYMGKKLQLFLYLNAFSDDETSPSGTYYYKISDNYLTPSAERVAQLDGKTVAEATIVQASDTLALDEKSKITGLSVNKIDKKTNALTSQEGLFARMQYAKILAEKGVEYLQDGFFPASPISENQKTACDYCEYGAICKFEKDFNSFRELISVSAKEMDEMFVASENEDE